MVICGHDDMRQRYRGRIEKVKFGVPVSEAFSHDIPATLLVLLLKVNKEGPYKKDIWRAPGNQAQVQKLMQIMQHGRLVNIANFSVYTAASVIKKFLSKLPGGIFGAENEQRLFSMVEQADADKQRDAVCRVVASLPVPAQHLLVLLLGTFRLVADAAHSCGTRMSPESIGVSVAPSLFHTCIHDGQRVAKIEDVVRFKMASEVVAKMVNNFGYTNLLPRENYEFYARISGRTLRVDQQYPQFTFQSPASDMVLQQKWLKQEAEKLGCFGLLRGAFSQPEVVVTPAGESPTNGAGPSGVYSNRACSLGEVVALLHDSPAPSGRAAAEQQQQRDWIAAHAASTRSLSFLEWVHEMQTKRMHSRSEWFLSPMLPSKNGGVSKSADMRSTSQSMDAVLHQSHYYPRASVPAQPSTSADAPPPPPPSVTPVVKSATGVRRQRSWRTHYVRPKAADTRSQGDCPVERAPTSTSEPADVSRDPSPLPEADVTLSSQGELSSSGENLDESETDDSPTRRPGGTQTFSYRF